MKSKYDYDTIRDYLHGLVDRETARSIRDLIRTDDIARNIAAGILQLEHEFKGDEHEIEAYIETLRQKQLKLIKEEGKTNVVSVSFEWMKLAAAILLIAIVGAAVWLMLFKGSSNNDLLAQELSEPYPVSVERGPSEANAGFEYYMRGEYESAIMAFDKVTDDVIVTFYNGLSNLYSGDYEKAAGLLADDLLKTSRYAEQAEWYRSLALLKAGRSDEAREILKKISSEVDHFKAEVARRLLETTTATTTKKVPKTI